jgi:hypothetical protein
MAPFLIQDGSAASASPLRASLHERLAPLMKKLDDASITHDSVGASGDAAWMRRASTWRLEILDLRKKAKAKKAKRWTGKRRHTLSSALQDLRSEEEAAILDNKNHSRFGPYSFRDVMEFKAFYEHFDYDFSGKFNMEAAFQTPLFTEARSNVHVQHIWQVLHDMHAERKQSLYTMEDMMEVTFPLCKHEERRRMVAIVDIHRLLKRVRGALKHPCVKNSREQLRALNLELELETQDVFNECLRTMCGTLTLREVPEVLQSVRLAKTSLSDMEAAEAKNGVDVHKELDGNDMLELLKYLIKTPRADETHGEYRTNYLGVRITTGAVQAGKDGSYTCSPANREATARRS